MLAGIDFARAFNATMGPISNGSGMRSRVMGVGRPPSPRVVKARARLAAAKSRHAAATKKVTVARAKVVQLKAAHKAALVRSLPKVKVSHPKKKKGVHGLDVTEWVETYGTPEDIARWVAAAQRTLDAAQDDQSQAAADVTAAQAAVRASEAADASAPPPAPSGGGSAEASANEDDGSDGSDDSDNDPGDGSDDGQLSGLARAAITSVGWPWDKGDPLNPASFNPVKAVSDLQKQAAPIFAAAQVVLSVAQGVVSLVPGLGQGLSAYIGAGLAILEGGGPIDIAIKTAYGAIPIPPGIRYFTDLVLDAALSVLHAAMSGGISAQNGIDAALVAARKAVLGKLAPGVAQELGGNVFDTLAHLILQAVGPHKGQPTRAVTTFKGIVPGTAAYLAVQKAAATQKAAAAAKAKAALSAWAANASRPAKPPPVKRLVLRLPHASPIAPTTQAHAAVAIAAQLQTMPVTLANVVLTRKPMVDRHVVYVPAGLGV